MICYQDVFERAYISDKLTRVGRRAARDPHRPQPVTGSRLIGVHTFSSMNFRDIPELPKSSKTDRLHFRNSGVIVEELVEEDADGPLVRVSLLLSLMPAKLVLKEVSQSPRMRVAVAAGHEVAKKYRKWLQTLALGVGHLAEAAKPAVTMQHLSKMTWTESDRCCLCLKTFRTYRRRHHCRFCGEAVCGSCSGFVNLSSFDVNYEGGTDNITVGHRQFMTSDSTEQSNNNTSKDNTEEFMETRACNTCVSELQMNLTMLSHASRQPNSSLYSISSSGSLSQLHVVSARLKNRSADHEDNQNAGYSTAHGPPPPYPGRDSSFEPDQVMPMHAGDYQHYQQQALSFSTISSSSYSGLSRDERARLAPYSPTSSAEFMGKAPPTSTSVSSTHTPSSFTPSDASLSAFLARDPDLLSLNGLTLSPGGSVAPSASTVMDDDKQIDFIYKPSNRPPYSAADCGSSCELRHYCCHKRRQQPQPVQLREYDSTGGASHRALDS
ncbi:hypothetical protein PR003_g17763 [Phytophthora rubi]|uniref:FYVE-type domain-containing protein n=1 Tax=Phytophthora rubi TaxID=129364 RepID=A0A6A4ECQ7_9STRA|nr:hypothetical protein PR002_g17135 [Phytophthora rubi]KAE9320273.1 hypothetical protein PR003_g17763 [Phytophthora rubi]